MFSVIYAGAYEILTPKSIEMKKILLIFAMAAVVLATGCKDKEDICTTSVYTVVNQIESDIVVELKFGDRQTMTIKPGEVQMVYSEFRCIEYGVEESRLPELLRAEMRIDGELVPKYIWWDEHWNIDRETFDGNYSSYILIVTEELLETIKTNRQN